MSVHRAQDMLFFLGIELAINQNFISANLKILENVIFICYLLILDTRLFLSYILIYKSNFWEMISR